MGIFLDLAEHLQRAEDGQAGADEGEELRIEDEEGLELDLARGMRPMPPRARTEKTW